MDPIVPLIVTNMRESCHTYESVMSHQSSAHELREKEFVDPNMPRMVTDMRESCHAYECVMSYQLWAHELREKEFVDLIVPLTHQSLASDERLAAAALGFPLILGVHRYICGWVYT